jgi:hypothetical protein
MGIGDNTVMSFQSSVPIAVSFINPQIIEHVKRLRVEIECANEVVYKKGGPAFGNPDMTIGISPYMFQRSARGSKD